MPSQMRQVVQWILCVMLSAFTLAGIVVSLVGALANPGGDVVMIVAGTLIVAVSSFLLTMVAKLLG